LSSEIGRGVGTPAKEKPELPREEEENLRQTKKERKIKMDRDELDFFHLVTKADGTPHDRNR